MKFAAGFFLMLAGLDGGILITLAGICLMLSALAP